MNFALPFEPTPLNVLFVVGAFILGGISKGTIGLGIPLIALPLLSNIMAPARTLAILVIPLIVTNLWQGVRGGYWRSIFRRFWPLIALMPVGMLIGVEFLTSVPESIATALVGGIVIVFALSQLFPFQFTVSPHWEKVLTPFFGLFAGLVGGVSGLIGPAYTVYIVALRLPKDEFVATISLIFTLGMIPLGIILAARGILASGETVASAGATVCVFIGVFLGQWLRDHVSQEGFRKVLLVSLIVIGINLIRKAGVF